MKAEGRPVRVLRASAAHELSITAAAPAVLLDDGRIAALLTDADFVAVWGRELTRHLAGHVFGVRELDQAPEPWTHWLRLFGDDEAGEAAHRDFVVACPDMPADEVAAARLGLDFAEALAAIFPPAGPVH